MDHNVELIGYGCKLRPATEDDSEFIVNLRGQNFAHGTIHQTSTDVGQQRRWMREYLGRDKDYYWIICATKGEMTPIGTIGLYDFMNGNEEAMPGRWVMFPQMWFNVMAPVFLVYQFAFEVLKVKKLIMDVVASNRKVRRFHELYGARIVECPKRYLGVEKEVGSKMVWYELSNVEWNGVKTYWQPVLEDF